MASYVSSQASDLANAMGGVKPTTLPRSLLKFPPASIPATIPPPSDHPTLAHPFSIPTNVYNALLSPTVPITVALIYMSAVSYFNTVNAQREYKPWAFSQTGTFKALVIVHNAILAAYSAWTCVGMINAVVLSFAGWRGEYTLAGAADSLCKIHGPRGLGSAATFNETSSAWQMTNRAFHLAADGLGPESTDVGRMWNEGLAFYGWLFYLSKFYEVIDTAIILAKGRKSSFLQTYHHAGAMLCMWAGIRYMSAPIWMFVLVNSGIHAIMYTFYLCTVLGVRVPKSVKQALTTVQIMQFVVGASYAFAHLFVAYKVPVSVPYLYHLGNVVSSVASAARSDAVSATSSVIASASAPASAWLKKLALRAAGREALAENVPNDRGQTFGVDAVHIVEDFISRDETRFRDELQWTHCLDTSGQVFAILLNCMYLAPLTWLFVRFFITAYLKRVERRRSSTSSEKAQAARQSLQDASKDFTRKVAEAVDEMHGHGQGDGEKTPLVNGEQTKTSLVDADQIKKTAEDISSAVRDKMDESVEKVKQTTGLGGGTDPTADLQNKSAEQWQEIPSDQKEAPASDSAVNVEKGQVDTIPQGSAKDDDKPRDAPIEGSNEKDSASEHNLQEHGPKVSEEVADEGESANAAVDDSTAAGEPERETTESSPPATEDTTADQSSPESSREEDVAPSPNEGGTGADEATGAGAPMPDAQPNRGDQDVGQGHAEKSGEEENQPRDADQPTVSADETEETPAQGTRTPSEASEPRSEDTSSDHPTSPEITVSHEQGSPRKPSDIEPATPDKEMAKKMLALRKASFEGRMTSPERASGGTAEKDAAAENEPPETVEPIQDDSSAGEHGADLEESAQSTHEKLAEQDPDETGDKADQEQSDESRGETKNKNEPQPADKSADETGDKPAENLPEDHKEKGEAEADEATAAAESEDKDKTQQRADSKAAEHSEDGEDRKSEDSSSKSREAKAPKVEEGTIVDDKKPKTQQKDDDGKEPEDEAEQMSFMEPEKGDEAEQMSFIEPEKQEGDASGEQKKDKREETAETEESTPAGASDPKPTTEPEQEEEATPPSEQKGMNPEDEEQEKSVPSKQEEQPVKDEKSKFSGEDKAHETQGTAEAPLMHVDEDAEKAEEEKAESKPPSTKSKTPSLKSKSSQSLQSKSSQSLKSKHGEEEEDKENQAPKPASEHAETGGDGKDENEEGAAKGRDDTSFVEGVKE